MASPEHEAQIAATIHALAPPSSPVRRLAERMFKASSLGDSRPPNRHWVSRDRIPGYTVTILAGDGGGGKSTLMLQAAVCAVLGLPWLGQAIERGPVVYLSAEDDRDEVWRRLDQICLGFGRQVSELDGLHLLDMSGEDTLLAISGQDRTLQATPLLQDLEERIAEIAPVLVVLDSQADVFGGDEIRRDHARQFIANLRSIAQRQRTTFVMLSHPSLSGMASGSGSSGSTHWNNSVRSRLYLTRPTEDDGAWAKNEARVLTVKKANYGPSGQELRLRLQAGLFVMDDEAQQPSDRKEQEGRVDATFLQLLDTFAAEGRNVSVLGPYQAPTLFANDPRSKGIRKRAFADAMNRLFAAGQIYLEEYGRGRKRLTRRQGAALA